MTIASGGRQVVIHGLGLILAGLLWGFVPPHTPYPRLAVGAHIQFESNGALFLLLGIALLTLPHAAGPGTARVLVATAWLTWLMVLSEVANAWWGANQLLPVAAAQAGAKGAEPWQELAVKLCHFPAAIGLVLSLVMLIAGFVRRRDGAK